MSSAEVVALQAIIDRLMPSPIAIPLRVLEIKKLPTTTDALTFRAIAQVERSREYEGEYSISQMAFRAVSSGHERMIYQCFETIGRVLLNDAYLDLVGMHFPDVVDRYHREMHERYEQAMRNLPTEIKVGEGFKDVTICGIPIHESLPISMIINSAVAKRKPPPIDFDVEYNCLPPPSPRDQMEQLIRLHDAGLISKKQVTELVGKMFPVVADENVPPGQMVFVGPDGKRTVVENIDWTPLQEPVLLPGAKFKRAREARIRIAFWRK